jgi:UTP-glucose-1-phosphate uridylyltransferase
MLYFVFFGIIYDSMNERNKIMSSALIVLAAGMGSRYGGLKQLDALGPNGEKLLEYSIYDAIQAGFEKVVFVIRHHFEKDFREAITNKFDKKVSIDFAYQETESLPAPYKSPATREKPWGTGHAVLVAADKVDTPFAVINADDFYGALGYRLLAEYLTNISKQKTDEYCMVGFVLRNTLSDFGTVSRGVCHCDRNNYLQTVVERTKIQKAENRIFYVDENGKEQDLTGEEFVSMNMWGFTPSFFRLLKDQFSAFLEKNMNDAKAEFFLPTAVDNLIKEGKARVKLLESKTEWFSAKAKEKEKKTDDLWFGLTYKEDKSTVTKSIQKLIDQGKYPQKLWS